MRLALLYLGALGLAELELQFHAGPGGFRALVFLDSLQVPLLVDSSSTHSFIYADVGSTWEPKKALSSRVNFAYSGNHTVEALSSVTRKLSEIDDRKERFLLGRSLYVIEGVFGVLSMSANSFLGKSAFALIPDTAGNLVRYTSKTDDAGRACPPNSWWVELLMDPTLLEQKNLFVVPGKVSIKDLFQPAQMVIATGKQGIELPAPLYARFLDSLLLHDVRLDPPNDANAQYLKGPPQLCAKEKGYIYPKIKFSFGGTNPIEIELGAKDFAFLKNGVCYIVITRAKPGNPLAIGPVLLKHLVTLIDAPNKRVGICRA